MRGARTRGMRYGTPDSKSRSWRSEQCNDRNTGRKDLRASRRDERIRHPNVRLVRSLSPRGEERKLPFDRREVMRDQHMRHSVNSRDDVRRSPIKVRRAVAASDEPRMARFDRGRSRRYSSSRTGDEDARHTNFPSESENGPVKNTGNHGLVRSADELVERNKNKDFADGPANGTVLDGYGMLVQKSIVLEDGSVRTFFTLPPATADPLSESKRYSNDDVNASKASVSYSVGNANFGFHNSSAVQYAQDPRYLESETPYQLYSSRPGPREHYGDEEKEKYYSRSAPYLMGLSQSKSLAVDTASPRLTGHTPLGVYRDSLHTLTEDFTGSDKFPNTPTHEGRRQKEIYGRASNSMSYGENLPAKSLQSYSGRQRHHSSSTDEALTGVYKEIMRERPECHIGSNEPYNKWQNHSCCYRDYSWSPPAEASQQYGNSMRSYFGDSMSDRMEDTGKFKRQLKEFASKDGCMQMDSVDSYGNMHRMYSPRAISTDMHGDPFPARRDRSSATLRMEASRSPPIRYLREDYSYRDGSPIEHRREVPRSPIWDPAISSHRSNLSMRSGLHLPIQGIDTCGPVDRMLKRKYAGEKNQRSNMRISFSNDQNKSRKIWKIDLNDEESRERQGGLFIERSFHGKCSHSVSDSRSLSEDKSLHLQGCLPESRRFSARISNSSKWTRSNLCHNDDYAYRMEEKQHHYHPCKSQKSSGMDDEQDTSRKRHYVKDEDFQDNMQPACQPDLPEDSEEFKQRVHKAYLRFSKVLNENPVLRKRYDEQGKYGSLFCIVCGRLSKDFVDTHRLVMHTFNSQKAGLRAEHLGLHKALCVLMGWSHAPPDNSRAYQLLSSPEATAMKEDLILWPPLVIVHNACNGKKDTVCQEGDVNLEMDEVLRELGFSSVKLKAVYGRDAHHETTVVKFMPTFSGLQEAERLHKYYKDNNHGRNDWLERQSVHRSQQNVDDENTMQKKRVLYGYIGIAEDLEKVDSDTRKRALVKSRKDIEAIVDGPVRGA